MDAVLQQFHLALSTEHEKVIQEALGLLANIFSDRKSPDESYRMDGPVAVARFEDDDADTSADEGLANQRVLRQRRAAEVVNKFVQKLIG